MWYSVLYMDPPGPGGRAFRGLRRLGGSLPSHTHMHEQTNKRRPLLLTTGTSESTHLFREYYHKILGP